MKAFIQKIWRKAAKPTQHVPQTVAQRDAEFTKNQDRFLTWLNEAPEHHGYTVVSNSQPRIDNLWPRRHHR